MMALQRSDELNAITQSFMLRRDASINKKHLPPKQELLVRSSIDCSLFSIDLH